jgi:hypothetical protein
MTLSKIIVKNKNGGVRNMGSKPKQEAVHQRGSPSYFWESLFDIFLWSPKTGYFPNPKGAIWFLGQLQ